MAALPGEGAPPPPSVGSRPLRPLRSGHSDGPSGALAGLFALFSPAGALAYAGYRGPAIAAAAIWIVLWGSSIALLAVAPRAGWVLVRVVLVAYVAAIPLSVVIAMRSRRTPRMTLCAVLIAITVVGGITLSAAGRLLVVQSFSIPSGSMVPSLAIGDHLFVRKIGAAPRHGDVVVFHYPREPDKDFIKRVIAVGGDTVQQDGDAIRVNGQRLLTEPCTPPTLDYRDRDDDGWHPHTARCLTETAAVGGRRYRVIYEMKDGLGRNFPPTTVPAGALYLVGDNRDNSHDSRYFGPVAAEFFVGVATFRYRGERPAGAVE